jgi:hypothetical protein
VDRACILYGIKQECLQLFGGKIIRERYTCTGLKGNISADLIEIR